MLTIILEEPRAKCLIPNEVITLFERYYKIFLQFTNSLNKNIFFISAYLAVIINKLYHNTVWCFIGKHKGRPVKELNLSISFIKSTAPNSQSPTSKMADPFGRRLRIYANNAK